MENVTFTIITVCYNAQEEIVQTLHSLKKQKYKNYELIIKDGKSKDNTLSIIEKIVADMENVLVLSDKDNGIYDAMNTAVDYATGDYIFFLNAGDVFADADVLWNMAKAVKQEQMPDVIYGNIIEKGAQGRHIRKNNRNSSKVWRFLMGYCICHQSIFVKRELFVQKKFDLSYRICADREWQLYYIKEKKVFAYVDMIVCEVMQEGFSSQNVNLLEQETIRCIRTYYGKMYLLIKTIYDIKKNAFIRNLLQKMDGFLHTKEQ